MRKALLIALMLLPLAGRSQTCPQTLLGSSWCTDNNPGSGCDGNIGGGTVNTTGSSLWIGVMTQENQQSPPMQNSMTTTSPTSTMTPLTYYDNVQIFYEYLPTNGTAVDFQCANSVGDNRFVCYFLVYSGVDNFDSGTDNGADSGITGVNSIQPGAITPNQVYDLIVTAGFQQTDIGDLTVSSPFSIANIRSTVFNQGAVATDTYNSISPINPTWTVGSGGGPVLMAAAIAGFHPGIPGITPGCPSGNRLRGYVIHSK